MTDANGTEIPRRAAINSYGFGGVNAHAIIEEFQSVTHKQTAHIKDHPNHSIPTQSIDSPIKTKPVIFVLSAKNKLETAAD